MQMVREKGGAVVGVGQGELWEMRVPEPTRPSPDRQPLCCGPAAAPQGSLGCRSRRRFCAARAGLRAAQFGTVIGPWCEKATPGWVCSTAHIKGENTCGAGIKLVRKDSEVVFSCQNTAAGQTHSPLPSPVYSCSVCTAGDSRSSQDGKPPIERTFKKREGEENRFLKSQTPPGFTNLD